MKKKLAANSKSRGNNCDGAKPKERHIVSWSQEEDDILREQIRIHGIDNWTIIASNFKDKTTRQCKRRWFTYLNADFKKGKWSPEEDMLLCEAQKIFGNRWTEIAKVVSGRTDNAVKNRFTTICKKKAKHEAQTKENITSYINLNNKRITFSERFDTDRISDVSESVKKLRRSHTIKSSVDDCMDNNQLLRHPFAVIAQNVNNLKETFENGTFLKKNNLKMNVLMQQTELLSSLALKVNSENTNQSLENAHKNLITDSSSNERIRLSKRQLTLSEESGGSSEYSTGSTLLSRNSQILGDQSGVEALENGIFCDVLFPHADTPPPVCDECEYPSPLQVTPQFRSLAAAIPSPKFSESERQFLLKTLGVDESTSPHRSTQPPSCKRALLQSL